MADNYSELVFSGTWSDHTTFNGDIIVDYSTAGSASGSTAITGGYINSSYGDYTSSNLSFSFNPANGNYYVYTSFSSTGINLEWSGQSPTLFASGNETTYGAGFIQLQHTLVSSTITATPRSTPCYAAGTRILTSLGAREVERLAVGDLVVTASHERRAIRWLGHRTVDCVRHPEPHTVWPVRVRTGAFGDGRPDRDLVLSPNHAVAVRCNDEVLIPIRHLVNGATIVIEPCDTVTYWHVGLDSHDLLVAEGMPAESYIEAGGGAFFSEDRGGASVPSPGAPAAARGLCRPLVRTGPLLEAVQARLAQRAGAMGWRATEAPDVRLAVDGALQAPVFSRNTARFTVPPGAREVRIVSPTCVPADLNRVDRDERALGVAILAIAIEAPGRRRRIPLDDDALGLGFHEVEHHDGTPLRWTNGEAHLAPWLWQAGREPVALDITVARTALPTWRRRRWGPRDDRPLHRAALERLSGGGRIAGAG